MIGARDRLTPDPTGPTSARCSQAAPVPHLHPPCLIKALSPRAGTAASQLAALCPHLPLLPSTRPSKVASARCELDRVPCCLKPALASHFLGLPDPARCGLCCPHGLLPGLHSSHCSLLPASPKFSVLAVPSAWVARLRIFMSGSFYSFRVQPKCVISTEIL